MKLLLKLSVSAVAAIGCLAASTMAAAAPITYSVFAVADVKLGNHRYHNAQVLLKFVGDTGDVAPLPAGTVGGYWISKGAATLQITSANHRINATFAPDQIVVSLDLDNGGGGFSSYVGSPAQFAPAYPLALDGSSIFNSSDLVTPTSWTGHAWSCLGFPAGTSDGGSGQCTDPAAYPLKTDHGDFFIDQPYLSLVGGLIYDDYDGSLNSGIFTITLGTH